MTQPTQSLSSLRNDLVAMGLKPADRILVHSSLRAVGPIEDGAEGLIRLLTDVLDQGALIMPAHTWETINAKNPRFYHATSPSCVGVLSEVYRTTPGVIRSAHPTHSNSGWGKGVEAMLRDQEKLNTPCGLSSTYGRLGEEGYKIVLVGVDFARNTAVHGLEERALVPGRLTEQAEPLEVAFADGTVVPSPQFRHTGPGSDRYPRIQPYLFERGLLHRAKLGQADVLWMDAAPMFDAVVDVLKKDPEYFTRESE